MGFLDWLANVLAPSVPSQVVQSLPVKEEVPPPDAPPQPVEPMVPMILPKIAATTAAEICGECEPEAGALELMNPRQTPAQFLAVLQARHFGADMVKVLAQGLPDREGVAWAVQCALRVADKLPVADAQAMRAAQAWVRNPTPELKAAAAAAAQRTDYQGPGAWAAQAAASAQTGDSVLEPTLPAGMVPPRLTPHAVGGAVMLCASLTAVPEYAARLHSVMAKAAGAAVAGLASAAAAAGAAGVAGARAAVFGMAGAGSGVPQVALPTGQLPPSLAAMPGTPSVPDARIPQLPGAPGRVQAGLGAISAGGSPGAAGASLPGVAGAMSSPAGAIAQGAASGGKAGAAAAAMGSVHALSGAASIAGGIGASVPGAGAMPGVALPNPQMPARPQPNLPSISQPNAPQMALHSPQVPAAPAPDPAEIFRSQQPFIEIGLGIASGRLPIA